MSSKSSSERNLHGVTARVAPVRPPALNGVVECVGHTMTVRHAVELLIDGMQYCFVFGHAGALGELVELACVFLVESECHSHTVMVSL